MPRRQVEEGQAEGNKVCDEPNRADDVDGLKVETPIEHRAKGVDELKDEIPVGYRVDGVDELEDETSVDQ